MRNFYNKFMEQLAQLPEKGIDVLQLHEMGDYLARHGIVIAGLCDTFLRGSIISAAKLSECLMNEQFRSESERGDMFSYDNIVHDLGFIENHYPDSIFKVRYQDIDGLTYKVYREEHMQPDCDLDTVNFREFYFEQSEFGFIPSHSKQGIVTREVLSNGSQIFSLEAQTYYPSKHSEYPFFPEGKLSLVYERV
jgi:hypothetical protein